MSEALQVFEFESQAVRTTLIDGEPWFVAADVCRVLGIQNVTQAVQRLDADERSMLNIGRQGDAVIISEGGLYTLILRSRDAVTPGTAPHRFRKWVTSDVIPAIRKTGSYSVPDDPDERALILASTVQRLIGEKRQLQAKIEADAPHVEGFKSFLFAGEAVSLNDLAKTLGYPPRKFTDHLKAIGVLMQNGTPYAAYANRGWFRIIQVDISKDGRGWFKQQVLVESVGQEGIYQLLKRKPLDSQASLFGNN